MNHLFSVEFAVRYGVYESIILTNFVHWIKVNHANNRNFHEGRAWTYNTRKALAEIFPYWSDQQVYRAIQSLIKQGALVTGNYNTDPRDRTMWYTLSTDIYETCIIRNQSVSCSESNSNKFESEQCYNRNTDNKQTDNKQQIININPLNPPKGGDSPQRERKGKGKKEEYIRLIDDFLPTIQNPEWQELVSEFLHYKIDIGHPLTTPQGVKSFFNRLVRESKDNITTARNFCEMAMANNWQSYHPDAGKSFAQQKLEAQKAEKEAQAEKERLAYQKYRAEEEEHARRIREQEARERAEMERKKQAYLKAKAEQEAKEAAEKEAYERYRIENDLPF